MAAKNTADGEPIVIKKYANRRLYNTQSSSYITLDDLARMVRTGVDFKVLDAKSGNDITHAILTQIIMEEEAHGEQMLPVSFLRDLISMYGNSMQSMMPPYLEAAMDSFRTNQSSLREAFQSSMGADAFSKMAEQNMAMFQAAAGAFIPGAGAVPGASGRNGKEQQKPASNTEDIDTLKAQMAEMQSKLDKLAK